MAFTLPSVSTSAAPQLQAHSPYAQFTVEDRLRLAAIETELAQLNQRTHISLSAGLIGASAIPLSLAFAHHFVGWNYPTAMLIWYSMMVGPMFSAATLAGLIDIRYKNTNLESPKANQRLKSSATKIGIAFAIGGTVVATLCAKYLAGLTH